MKESGLGLLLCAALLAGCASSGAPVAPVAPLSGPRAEVVNTAYSEALRCLAGHVRAQEFAPPRVAVGLITDMTGAQDRDNGRRLTQGATLMAITALSESGVRLVERYDMGVLQVEMDYARNGLVRDSDRVVREVRSGEIQGADLYLIGGISEYNPNIRSRGIDGFASGSSGTSGSVSVGAGDYVVDVALDLRLVDARSSEVLGVRSLRKQVIGREIRAGVFAFLDGTVVDIGGGQRAMEPVQTAVRTMVDQIVFEFISALYALDPAPCLDAHSFPQHATADRDDARGRLSPALEAEAPRASLSARPAVSHPHRAAPSNRGTAASQTPAAVHNARPSSGSMADASTYRADATAFAPSSVRPQPPAEPSASRPWPSIAPGPLVAPGAPQGLRNGV
jgi:curli biogenesis system outer membrane secretion channel CsgG